MTKMLNSAKSRFSLAVLLFLLCCQTACAETENLVLKKARSRKTISAQVVKRVGLPRGYHEGLFFDGKNIWVNNGRNKKTWVVDPISGRILSAIDPVGLFTEGMTAVSDGSLFVTDWAAKSLFRVHISADKMVEESSVSVLPAHPTGIAWDGVSLYVVTWTRGVLGTKFHLLEMKPDGTILRKFLFRYINEPAHLAWDGKNLWVTSWYDKFIYKLDIGKREIAERFRSPVSRTTGIAWDGSSFWITGTYSDLYQVRLGPDS